MRSLAILTVVLLPLCGQDSSPTAWREKVDDAIKEGRERVALGLLATELEKPAAAAEALELFADVATNVGEFDRADVAGKRWLAEHPKDQKARIARARQLWRRSEHQGALDLLAPLLEAGPEKEDAPKWSFSAVALAGEIHVDRGERDQAEKLFDRLVEESQRVVIRDAKDLDALGRAVAFFGGKGIKEAERDFVAAQKAGADWTTDTALGWLYLRRMYLWADAAEEFKTALRKRPAYMPALIGLAAAYAYNPAKQEDEKKTLEKAASVSPSDPDLLAIQAQEDLDKFILDKAGEKITRGLATSPKHKKLLSLKAGLAYLQGRKAEADSMLESILKLDPAYGEGLRTIASILNERRRWPECLELMTRAIAINPTDPALLDDHARYALYLGQNALAKESYERANDADNFSSPWRHNIWELMAWIAKKYTTHATDRFAVRLFTDDSPALSRTLLPFMEKSYRILSAKYQYVPEGVEAERNKLLIEVFRNHQSFSVRTMGFDGLGALGVCFGPFIAMDAPNAREPGEFSWARTFHHELAHTMTVGLTKGRVPRWFTEGLSTFEESEYDPSWTRGMDRELFDAFHTGRILKLADFDAAFSTPRVIYAYYQAGLESEWIVKTYGIEKVIEALKLFAEDLPQEEVFKRAFGVPTAHIDAEFAKVVAARVAPMKMQPRYAADVREELEAEWKAKPSDEVLVKLAWARWQNKQVADAEGLLAEAEKRRLEDPRLELLEARLAERMGRSDRAKVLFEKLAKDGHRDYDLAFDLAKAAEKRGDPVEALRLYREAIACFPTNAAKDGPRPAVARLLRGEGKTDEAQAMLEEHLRYNGEDLAALREVIDWKRVKGDWKGALAGLQSYVLVNPLDGRIHQTRADLLVEHGEPGEALVAADCAVDTSPTPIAKASAHVTAAAALVKLDRKDEARGRLEEALRLAPQHAAAQKALAELESRPSGDRD
jgi:tetratricopeptide (TPR) repeat protein